MPFVHVFATRATDRFLGFRFVIGWTLSFIANIFPVNVIASNDDASPRASPCTSTTLGSPSEKSNEKKEGKGRRRESGYLTRSWRALGDKARETPWVETTDLARGVAKRVARGACATLARPWFSGNRQRSGAIKRVICVLQFDPAALLGTVRRDRRVIYANSSASGDLSRATGGTPGFRPRPRCHNVVRRVAFPALSRSIRRNTRRAEGRRSPGVRVCAHAASFRRFFGK